jgi:tetratricopeptide (TPR) repeat protein
MLALIGSSVSAACAGERVTLAGNVEVRIAVLDELRNSVAEDRFVEGETILVRATVSDLSALQAKLDLDKTQRSPDQHAQAVPLEVSSLQEVASQLVLVANEKPLQGETQQELRLQRVERHAAAMADARPHSAQVELWWSVDPITTRPGRVSLVLDVPSHPHAGPATREFEVVSPEQATRDNHCRALYVKARIALDAGRDREAAEVAERATQVGEPLGYHRMFAMRVLGDALYALGNRRAALDAYRESVRIAEAAFPKSDLPVVLGPRIRELEKEQ